MRFAILTSAYYEVNEEETVYGRRWSLLRREEEEPTAMFHTLSVVVVVKHQNTKGKSESEWSPQHAMMESA